MQTLSSSIFKVIFSLSIFATGSLAVASAIEDFNTYGKKLPTSELKHSFCYAKKTSKGLEFEGANVKGKIRMASVSKLATTLWTLSTVGPFYRFQTQFSYSKKDKTLHISGGRDPFFGRRAMNFVLSELNRLGITEVELVTFDQAFTYFPSVEDSSMHYTTIGVAGGVSLESVRENLDYILNTSKWTPENYRRYNVVKGLAQEMGLTMANKPEMAVLRVEYRERESFVPSEDAVVFEYNSSPVYQYLKQMNIYSLNYTADELFRFLGGSNRFSNFALQSYGYTRETLQMNTGSGLPDYDGANRIDNYSNCETLVRVISSSEDVLKSKSKLDLKDVMLVAGVDSGTIGHRYDAEGLRGSVVAKTGTVDTAISLAGFINTLESKIFFGLFWQIKDSDWAWAARNYRDQVVKSLVQDLGATAPVKYAEYAFIPFDKRSQLKPQLEANSLLSFSYQNLDLNFNALSEAVQNATVDSQQEIY